MRALGSPDWGREERFVDAVARLKNRRELIALLDAAFATRTLEEWSEIFDREDVWFAPVNRLEDVADDPQAVAAHAFVEIPECEARSALQSPASPVDFDGSAPVPRAHCPDVGEHSEEIRRGLPGGDDEPPV